MLVIVAGSVSRDDKEREDRQESMKRNNMRRLYHDTKYIILTASVGDLFFFFLITAVS